MKRADGTPWGEDDVVNLLSLLCVYGQGQMARKQKKGTFEALCTYVSTFFQGLGLSLKYLSLTFIMRFLKASTDKLDLSQ